MKYNLPILGDIKGPLELEMGLLVVIDEGGSGSVVTTGQHAGWGIFLSDWGVSAFVEWQGGWE